MQPIKEESPSKETQTYDINLGVQKVVNFESSKLSLDAGSSKPDDSIAVNS